MRRRSNFFSIKYFYCLIYYVMLTMYLHVVEKSMGEILFGTLYISPLFMKKKLCWVYNQPIS